MQRGKSQVLFRYLPECIIDHSDTQAIAKISAWNSIKSESTNEARLASEILHRLERFGRKHGYPQIPRASSFVFLEPSAIEAELFPLTFICNKCGKAYSFDSIERFRSHFTRSGYHCTCGGGLRQLDLINYHICGSVSSLQVKKCPTHGFDHIILHTGNSSRISNWRWRCKICGAETGRVMGWCSQCNQSMETAPFRKSQVFYPHSISLINTKGISTSESNDNPDTLKLYIAQYLGIISSQEYADSQDSARSDSKQEEAERIRQKMIQEGFPEELINRVIGTPQGSERQKKRQETLQEVEEALSLDHNTLISIVSSLQSFQDTIALPGAKEVNKVLAEAQARGDQNLSRIAQFPDALKRAGINEAYVVNDLPVISAVFGYSRSTTNPGECVLRGFKPDAKYPDKTPIYVNPTETEGIVIVFDRWRILRWLQANGFVSDIPDRNNESGLKQWFLKNIKTEDIPPYDEIPDSFRETKAVYTLIHTISHVLLRKAAGLVGMDKDSLAEIIFPEVPAIAIYTNNAHDFQIGGMHTLFETAIIPWIDMAFESAETCLYDPVCISSDASCHACLHISEISCVHFNRDLGRHYLIGRENEHGRIFGFWEHEFAKKVE